MFSFGNKKSNRRRQGKATAASAIRPRLERRNAAKNIDYEVPCVPTSWEESASPQTSRSLDFSPGSFSSQSSFRIGGSIEGEVEHLYRSLGLSGPEDFAIPIAAWEASLKARSSSDILARSRLLDSVELNVTSDLPAAEEAAVFEGVRAENGDSSAAFLSCGDGDEGIMGNRLKVLTSLPLSNTSRQAEPVISPIASIAPVAAVIEAENRVVPATPAAILDEETWATYKEPVGNRCPPSGRSNSSDVGIRGARPPVLTPPPVYLLPPPPAMSLPTHDRASSTWDILRSFAPVDESQFGDRRISSIDDENEDEDERVGESEGGNDALERSAMVGESSDCTGSFSTSMDDDSSSTTTEFVISPNGRFKKHIQSWMRGQLLGSGSFGTVYEAISDDGTFIAVKEVSLLDKGSNAQQCILQLEQEIALLSQFEHENIVQYYGTDKEESKLFIFLELVTQGSLASLYQKYHLRDSQASAYTRQILNGLNYLHERDVVHRDIKCANILVHANGSIKLADFGLAKEISKLNELKSCKGSVYWMAPEVVNPRKTYGRAADIWSLGCTVLEMLTCQIPYPNVEWQHAFYRIGRGDQPPIPGHLSRSAQDFISKCVQVDPNSRPTAAQLLGHPFVTRKPLGTYSY